MDKIIHCRNTECKNYYEDGCFIKDRMIVIDEKGKCESFIKGLFEGYKTCKQCKNYIKSYKHIRGRCGLFFKKVTYNGELCKEFK
jgi:hypothetical protein